MIRIKVCGVTRLEDALLASDLGASAIGFIFWPRSPRFIAPEAARRIVARLPPLLTPVGVFVDEPFAEVQRVAALVKLGAVQLHGQETPDSYEQSEHRVIKAVALGDGFRPELVDRIPDEVALLLDAHDPVRFGGTGRTVDWAIAAEIARKRRVILSGGLRPENVAEAIETVQPYGVDVSSGVEERPGIKAADRLRAFFAAARTARRPGSVADRVRM